MRGARRKSGNTLECGNRGKIALFQEFFVETVISRFLRCFKRGHLHDTFPRATRMGATMPPILIPPRGKVDFSNFGPLPCPATLTSPARHTQREKGAQEEKGTLEEMEREKRSSSRRGSTFRGVCCCETSGIVIRVITEAAVAQPHYGIRCSASNLGRSRHTRYHIHSRHQHCDTHRQGEAAGGRWRGRRGSASVCACVRSTAGTAAHKHANKIDLNSSINHNNHCRCPF